MGVGYVVIAPRETEDVLRKECEKKGITVFELGVVKTGEKQVVMQSHGFTFESD
jgi:phosphoribosylaminoimidazole (AIR) synthetase